MQFSTTKWVQQLKTVEIQYNERQNVFFSKFKVHSVKAKIYSLNEIRYISWIFP